MKADRVETLRTSRGSYAVKFQAYTDIRRKHSNALICVFEGEDAKYYGCRIASHCHGLHWYPLDAGGRRIVCKLFELIKGDPKYADDQKVVFFIDRDFGLEEHPKSDSVYVTPCYSIENLYLSERAVRLFLASCLGSRDGSSVAEDIDNLAERYRKLKTEFLDGLFLLNAWFYAVRKRELLSPSTPPTKANANDFDVCKYVSIDWDAVSVKYNAETLMGIWPISKNEFEAAEAEVRSMDPELAYRGHYSFSILKRFLALLAEQCNKGLRDGSGKLKFSNPGGDLLLNLSSFAETPHCLCAFLSRIGASAGS